MFTNKKIGRKSALFAVSAALLAFGTQASAAVLGYALDETGSNLVSFDVSNPSTTNAIQIGDGTQQISAIDFRPATGDLIAYSNASNSYFSLNTSSGALSAFAGGLADDPTNTPRLDLDWNPTIDRMRLVTQTDQNIVFNPNDGGTTAVNNLFYNAGDVNEGQDPSIVANGYTNSFAGNLGGTTQQFAIDSQNDSLVTLANNAGTLTTVGLLGFDVSDMAGLDIFSGPIDGIGGPNMAYALLNVAGISGLYSIDLSSGQASMLGNIGNGVTLTGLAIASVPTPASMLLFLPAGLLLMRASRRKQSN
jgi:hypothetical protein